MITLRSLLSVIPVAVVIAAGSLQAQTVSMTVDQPSLYFSAQSGGAVVSQTVNVGSSNNQAINFNVQYGTSCGTWLKAVPLSDTTPKQITITADPSALTPGTYTGCVVSILGNGPAILGVIHAATIQVTFTVSSLSVNPASVVFPAYQAGTSTFPTPQSIAVTGGTFTISKAAADNWYTAAISGTPANTVLVFVDQSVLPTLSPNSYTGTLTITPTGANAVPINVPISLTVAALPMVTIAPSPATGLAFQWQVAGTNNQAQQNIVLSSNATGPLAFTLAPSTSWIKLPSTNPNSLQPAGTTVAIGVDGTSLPAQAAPYTGTVTVTVTGGLFSNGQNTINIPISLTVSNFPLINVPASSLSFSYQFASGAAVAAANITPASSAAPGTQLQFTVGTSSCGGGNWLVVPAGLQTTGTAFAVSVSPTVLATLAPQTYTCNLTVTPSGTQQAAISIPVTLTVTNTPTLQVSATALVFPYQTGLSPVAPAPASQTVTIGSNSGVPLNYTVSAPLPTAAPWLKVTGNPSLSGTTDQTSITIGVDPTAATAGTSDATVTVSATDPATGLSAGTQSIDVKLYVSTSPLLVVTPTGPIVLSGIGQSPGQPISLTSTNATIPLTTTVQFNDTGNWLSSNTPPTSTPGSFTIFGTPTGGMTPGTYPGTITINAAGPASTAVADAPYTIPVTYQFNAASAAVQPTTLSFSQPLGGQAPTAKQVSVTTSGPALPFTAVANDGAVGWLIVTSGTGTTPGTFNVTVNASRLTSGTYSGAVYVTVPTAGQIRIPVSFTVTPGAISAPTTALNFTQIAGGSAPAAQTVAVTGTTTLNFSVSSAVTTPAGGNWLSATVGAGSATSGATPANVQVSVNAGSLQPGTYAGIVTITSASATGSPISIPVNLTVVAPSTLAVSPSKLTFNYVLGTSAPASQSFNLTAASSGSFTATASTTDGASWLTVSPSSGTAGTTATPITAGINTAVLTTAGNYTGTITINSPAALAPATVSVSLSVVAIPTPVIVGIQNDASFTSTAIAPGENIVIYGNGIGPAQLAGLLLTPGGTVANAVAGTQVFFDNNPAPIIYVSATQTSVMVPEQVAGRTTTQITVVYQGVSSLPLTYNVVAAAPGIYTQNAMGSGPGSILNTDYSLNGPTKPAAASAYVMVYLTGTGDTTPAMVTGAVNPADGSSLKNSLPTYTATVAGAKANINYQGTAPGFVEGVMQFNVQIPPGTPSGPQPIIISSTVGNTTYSTQAGVTVQVK